MAKKITVFLLMVTMLFSMVACNGGSKNVKYEGSITDLMAAVYEKNPVELMISPATPVDLTDENQPQYYLGISDVSTVKEAVVSETMMGSQAYSFAIIRVAEGADIEAVKKNVLDGIDPRKWICVGADKVIVGNYGDVIVMIMADSNLSETLADDLYNAFSAIVGEGTGKKLERVETF